MERKEGRDGNTLVYQHIELKSGLMKGRFSTPQKKLKKKYLPAVSAVQHGDPGRREAFRGRIQKYVYIYISST